MTDKLMKLYGGFLVMLIVCWTMFAMDADAATATSDLTMVVDSSCYTYTAKTATSAYRKDYITFGEEVEVKKISGSWAKIVHDGQTQYIKSSNLAYQEDTVIKNRVMVSKGAYACSSSTTLGYVFYGTDVSVLDEKTTKSGVTYVHCLIEKTYKSDGVTVKAENVEGYINKKYLDEKAVPKVVNLNTSLYSCAYGSSASADMKAPVDSIYMGEEVEVLMSNKTWSKIRYDEKIYYISTGRLDNLQLQVLVNRVAQTYDAKPGSGLQHYVYWNTPITVLNTYESDTYGTYYYCYISGDYGFVREYSSKGIQYVGYQDEMITNGATTMYKGASVLSGTVKSLTGDTKVTVEYENDTWARVSYQGKTGYILVARLEQPKYQAKGSYYSTAYRMYKKNASGTVNEEVSLIAQKDKYGFSYVENKDGKKYWIASNSLTPLSISEKKYTTNPSTTLHKSASNESDEVAIPYMTEVVYQGIASESQAGKWLKVKYDNATYYVWESTGAEILTAEKSTYTYTTSNKYQKEVVEQALYIFNNWDTKYVHGQSNGVVDTDGKYGFDCSGFASYVIDFVMQKYVPTYNISANIVDLYKTTGIYNKGYTGAYSAKTVLKDTLDESSLKPGDVLFFDVGNEEPAEGQDYNHCGVYLGNGEFIHSTHSWDGGVMIMPLCGIYEEGFVAARRYLPTSVKTADVTKYTNSQKTKVYASQDSDQTSIKVLAAEVPVTVKYTDNGNWAYVEYAEGKFGFILEKYLDDEIKVTHEKKYVSETSLKLYESYSTSSDHVVVMIGTEVEYMNRYSTSSYYKVLYDEKEYYIYAPDGIDACLTDDYGALMAGTGTTTVASNTKFRSEMDSSTDDNVIRMLYSGDKVTVIAVSDSGTWTYIKDSTGQYGFVLSKYLD